MSLFGCATRQRTQQVYEEWGRASLQGEALRGDEIGVAAQSDGSLVMQAWFAESSQNGEIVHIQTLNTNNEIVATYPLELRGESPSDLQLLTRDEMATAAWIEQVGNWRVLRTVSFEWDGTLGEERMISAENSDIRWFNIQYTNKGFYIFWLDDNDTLFGEHFHNGETDRIFEQADVRAASFAESADSTLHIVWVSAEQRLTYTQLSPNRPRPRSVSGLSLNATDLSLLLDKTHAYVTWLDEQSLQPFYTTFPIPDVVSADLTGNAIPLSLPVNYPPHSATPALDATNNINTTVALAGQREEATLAATMQLQTRNRQRAQPIIIYFQAGAIRGQQMLTWTDENSRGVGIAADGDDNLYLSWVDVQRGDRPVYLMTTQPELRDAIDELTLHDYRVILVRGGGRLFQAFKLIPRFLSPLLTSVFYFFFVIAIVSGNTVRARARNAFLLGIILYEAVKFWVGLRGDVALLRFIPNMGLLDPVLYQRLVYLVPLLILIVCTFFVWLFYLHRARKIVHSTWFIALILLDYTFSLAFYAIEFFA